MSTPKRYNPWLVGIHWITALLVLLNLLAGMLSLKWLPNDASKITPLAIHMTLGIVILILTVIRIFVRMSTKSPAPASAGNPILDKIAVVTHVLLYLGALGMGISGIGISQQAGLADSVFRGIGALPADFYIFPPRLGHGFLSSALLALALLHIGAALYHQFILRDGLLSRMGFGKS